MYKRQQQGIEAMPAKMICASGPVHDLTVYVRGLTDGERQILLDGCLMNYYKNQHTTR